MLSQRKQFKRLERVVSRQHSLALDLQYSGKLAIVQLLYGTRWPYRSAQDAGALAMVIVIGRRATREDLIAVDKIAGG